jgi:hypothetical protein
LTPLNKAQGAVGHAISVHQCVSRASAADFYGAHGLLSPVFCPDAVINRSTPKIWAANGPDASAKKEGEKGE